MHRFEFQKDIRIIFHYPDLRINVTSPVIRTMAMQLQTTTSCLGITILLSGFIVNNLIVNDVYMDEEFHYRQTKSYCEGKYYEWDSKITTLPGLYFIAVLFAKASSHLYLSSYCSLSSLRFLSMCFSLGNLVLICRIRQRHEVNASISSCQS